MKNTSCCSPTDDIASGYVYVMTHSIFSDVVRIGCTPKEPEIYAKTLSASVPGEYHVMFSLACENPCQIKKQVRDFLKAKAYVNEFYQVPAEVAQRLLTRETLRIPIINN